MQTNRQKAAGEARAMCEARRMITKQIAPEFAGKADPRIRAIAWPEPGRVVAFDYRDTLAVAALIRKGVPPQVAAAIVSADLTYVVPVDSGEKVAFPESGNFEPVEVLLLADGTKWAVFMDDVDPTQLLPELHDVWALKLDGTPVDLTDYDPTTKLNAWCEAGHLKAA